MEKFDLSLKDIIKIILIFVLVVIFLFLGYNVSQGYINKSVFERDVLALASKNDEKIFCINEITLFSSADSDAEIRTNSTLNINDLYQYTDIAIFVNPVQSELNEKNTLKDVYIDNINFGKKPEEGTPSLYYKSITDFASSRHSEENKIEKDLHFKISSEDEEDLSTPILYNNCANPISLSFVNNNIKKNYTLPDAFTQIAYDGSLLKRCSVTLASIEASVSFDIHITNNLEQEFICPVFIEIPLELEDGSSIYDGKVLLKDKVNYAFYRYN